ncbi:MAG: HRDC domain-containing protein, partial [Myxococcota bacterium]
LEQALLDYAASDVAHLHDLHDALSARLAEAGRLPWAEEEAERLRTKPRGFPEPEEVWWKLKGKGKLRGSARGVAQALGAWRERRAAARDLPPRSILSDMALLQLAQRPPEAPKDLDRLRDADRRRIRRAEADDVLAAVREGLALRGEALRLPPRPPRDLASPAAVALAQAWVAQVARREGLDPAILASRDEVARFARGVESRLGSGWRHTLAGADVAALLAGKVALVLRDEALWLVDVP